MIPSRQPTNFMAYQISKTHYGEKKYTHKNSQNTLLLKEKEEKEKRERGNQHLQKRKFITELKRTVLKFA